jgi:hypothetical protein
MTDNMVSPPKEKINELARLIRDEGVFDAADSLATRILTEGWMSPETLSVLRQEYIAAHRVSTDTIRHVEKCLAESRAAVIEECAKVAEDLQLESASTSWNDACQESAAAIRALAGQPAEPRIPALRCDQCDNGINPGWTWCPWCGVIVEGHPDDQESRAAPRPGSCRSREEKAMNMFARSCIAGAAVGLAFGFLTEPSWVNFGLYLLVSFGVALAIELFGSRPDIPEM